MSPIRSRIEQLRPSQRLPLNNVIQSASTIHIKTTPTKTSKSRVSISSNGTAPPHHESLLGHGPLTVGTAANSPENKRLSALTNEEPDSKRSSQISSTSTNASGKKKKSMIGPWQLGSSVGKGTIGKVRKARHVTTGQQAAVKIISKKVAEAFRAESLANLTISSKARLRR